MNLSKKDTLQLRLMFKYYFCIIIGIPATISLSAMTGNLTTLAVAPFLAYIFITIAYFLDKRDLDVYYTQTQDKENF